MGPRSSDDNWIGHRNLDDCRTSTYCHFEEFFGCYEWHTLMKTPARNRLNPVKLQTFITDERGSVESALVLIPLLITFLIGFQMAYVAHARNVARNEIQNQASVRAISGKFGLGDRLIHIDSSGDSQNLDLLVAEKSGSLLNFLPNLLGISANQRVVGVNGIAIVENAR
jgi:hypothetical protein